MSRQTPRFPISVIVARVASRTMRRIARDPFTIIVAVALVALWLLAPFGSAATNAAASDGPGSESAEQYFRALRDHDPGAFIDALSPQARRALEVRFGLPTPAAAAALFREQQARGERISGWEQLSRYRTAQGDELCFYIVHYARGDEQRDVPYVLTIGADGKVEHVE